MLTNSIGFKAYLIINGKLRQKVQMTYRLQRLFAYSVNNFYST